MMGICEGCGLRTRIRKKTKLCAPCVRNFLETIDKYFDGDPFLPLKIAAEELKEEREAMSELSKNLERARKLREKLQDLVTLECDDGPIVANADRTYTIARARLKAKETEQLLAAEFDAAIREARREIYEELAFWECSDYKQWARKRIAELEGE